MSGRSFEEAISERTMDMNDRNAFLHGQSAPIKDDAPPPEQGWRGERSATDATEEAEQSRRIPGLSAPVEEVSGVAYAESQGLQSQPEGEEQPAPMASDNPTGASPASRPDGVNDLSMAPDKPGGQSAGGPYPHGERKGGNDPTSLMGHGGQSEMNYHGPGHLGDRTVDDDDNRNGVAEGED